MPLIKSASKAAFSKNVSEMMHAGHPQKQALAAAYATQREAKGRAFGGVAPMMAQAFNPMGVGAVPRPIPTQIPMAGMNASMPNAQPRKKGGKVDAPFKADGKLTTGPLVSAVPGRTDLHDTHVPSGSYVIPADIVSAHGEGNTLAGIKVLHNLFRMGQNQHPNPSSPIYHPKKMLALGGNAHKHAGKPVPVRLAGGEIVVPPENVHETMQRVSGKKMTLDDAHRAMDKWVVNERKKLRKTLAKLPPPAKD